MPPPVSFNSHFLFPSRWVPEAHENCSFATRADDPRLGGLRPTLTLLEADRVLRRSRSQSGGRMAQAGLYYTALRTLSVAGRSVIVGAARACETILF